MRAQASLLSLFAGAALFAACASNVLIDDGADTTTTSAAGGAPTTPTGTSSPGTSSPGTTSPGTTSGTTSTTTPTTTSTWSEGTTSSWCGDAAYFQDPSCRSCAVANCCYQVMACGPACADILTCTSACAGPIAELQACIDACTGFGSAPGFFDAQEVTSCVASACGDQPSCSPTVACASGFEPPNPACKECLGAQCCGELTACEADFGSPGVPGCFACLTGAADPNACSTNVLYANVTSCRNTQCPDPCAAEPGICDSGLTTNDAACDACLGSLCCAPITACVADSVCLDSCILGGQQSADCVDPSTPAGALFQAIQDCWNAECSDALVCGMTGP